MDELARRYLLLGLRLDRISPGFVDSYVGPSELTELVASEPLPAATMLTDEARALSEMATALPGTEPRSVRRRAWFAGQLRAIDALARRVAGEERPYLELVEALTGLRVGPVPDGELRRIHARLDAVLPGSGTLAERIGRLRDSLRIPPDNVVGAIRRSAERFRAATRRDFDLPDDEGIDWEATHDQPWGAFARYVGRRRTRILVNVDLPADVTGIAYLAWHEGYPGHHADHVVKDRFLVTEADLGEAMLRTHATPESVISEGLADVAREVVMSDRELEAELRRIGREGGLEGDCAAAAVMRTVMTELSAAISNAGLLLHHQGLPAEQVRDYLADVGLLPADRLDHVLRVLDDPVRGMYFPYSEGARLIRPWLETQGQTTGFWRLLSEQLSPAVLLDELASTAPGPGHEVGPAAVGEPA